MSANIKDTQFVIGEHVVYPLQGVGIIKDIEERNFRGDTILYYVIYLDISDTTVKIPVAKSQEKGIRGIVETKEAMEAINSISKDFKQPPVDWKARYQMNVELLKEGSINSIARVVQTLYHRSKVKELPVQERRLYDSALRILIDEAAYSLDKEKDEIQMLIFSKLE